jgi:hypothetical protein
MKRIFITALLLAAAFASVGAEYEKGTSVGDRFREILMGGVGAMIFWVSEGS